MFCATLPRKRLLWLTVAVALETAVLLVFVTWCSVEVTMLLWSDSNKLTYFRVLFWVLYSFSSFSFLFSCFPSDCLISLLLPPSTTYLSLSTTLLNLLHTHFLLCLSPFINLCFLSFPFNKRATLPTLNTVTIFSLLAASEGFYSTSLLRLLWEANTIGVVTMMLELKICYDNDRKWKVTWNVKRWKVRRERRCCWMVTHKKIGETNSKTCRSLWSFSLSI